ncbi:MAG: tetratricopeptide repeat protein, partial [Pseudomonadota bacterium]
AAEDRATPSGVAAPRDGTADGAAKPEWLERLQGSLANVIIEQLIGAESDPADGDALAEPAEVTEGDGGAQSGAIRTRFRLPAPAADPAPVHRCDRLAGSSSDPYAVVDGNAIGEIRAAEAVPACQEAVHGFPDEIRFAFQLGRAFYAADRFQEAAQWFGSAAESGHAGAMNNLGTMYRAGRGVREDPAEAFAWFSRSADAGAPQGVANLGWLYREGIGVPRDDVQAVKWFRQAANMGQPFAMRMLGQHYAVGRGVETDYREAARWYRQAARLGNAGAMSDLAWAYLEGIGLPQNAAEAARWYRAAADLGLTSARSMLASLTLKGRGVPQDEALAARLYLEAAEAGDVEAMVAVGVLYLEGRGVEPDAVVAAGWVQRAAEAGSIDAMTQLALLLDSGRGLAADPTAAADWLYRALRGGGHRAYSALESGYGSAAMRAALTSHLKTAGFLEDGTADLAPALKALRRAMLQSRQ